MTEEARRPAVCRIREASLYIGLEESSDWLLEQACPVPRVDIRLPGARRARWRWLYTDLDAFLASRRVLPGQGNPQHFMGEMSARVLR
jgi:hypothetical protein